jgi:hypothetical protein
MDFGKIQLVILVDLYSPGTPGPFVLCVSSRKQTMGKGAGAGADGHEADKEVSSFLLVVQKKKGGGARAAAAADGGGPAPEERREPPHNGGEKKT